MGLGIDAFWIVERFIKLFRRLLSPTFFSICWVAKAPSHSIENQGHVVGPAPHPIAKWQITIVKTGTINSPTLSHLLHIDLIEKIP